MSYQVWTGGGGLGGWSVLNRTGDRQRELVASDGTVRTSSAYYRQNIGGVDTVGGLLSDYRLLNVSLRAFGLQADIGNKAFLRKILESDLSDQGSLANRLSNKSYRKLAEAFGFGANKDGAISNKTATKGFAEEIVAGYVEREFESRVGQTDENLRLALTARRELSSLAAASSTNDTKWYEVLGNTPLRKVFQGAFGFSDSYGKLPIDRQLQEYKSAAVKMFGSDDMARFSDEDTSETLVRNFLVRSAVQSDSATNRYSTALALLSAP